MLSYGFSFRLSNISKYFVRKFVLKHYQSVKPFGSRPEPAKQWSWSWSKLFKNVTGRWEMTTVTASKQKLYILKDFRNAPPAKMLINCQNFLL